MPRKVKKSKSQPKKKKSRSKSKGESLGDSDLEDAIKTDENVKIMVPIEILSDKQLDMLKLAQSLKMPKIKIGL